jgi:hypothetical protein
MAFDELKQQVETLLGCQIGVELVVGLIGSIKARENLDDALHDQSLPEGREAHQQRGGRIGLDRPAKSRHRLLALNRGSTTSVNATARCGGA